MQEITLVTKTSSGILSSLGLKKKVEKEVFKVTENSLFYNSTLGNIGEIKSDVIEFIKFGKAKSTDVIKIGLKGEFKTKFKYKLKKFQQKLSELYLKEYGAEILIFPQDIDIEINEMSELLKSRLKK